MLSTISHGLGVREKSVEEQRRFQGAMCFGGRDRLSHEEIEKGVFLPGGVWFFLACFGAGTPSQSEYYHWLSRSSRFDGIFRSMVGGTRMGPSLSALNTV
jgi:hypothetical protein